jgi:hypothetical protein
VHLLGGKAEGPVPYPWQPDIPIGSLLTHTDGRTGRITDFAPPLRTPNREPVYFVLLVPQSKRTPPITETTTTERCEEWTASQTLRALQHAKGPQQQTIEPTRTNSDPAPTSESDAADDDDNHDAPPTTLDAETPVPQFTGTESNSDANPRIQALAP